ncbi:sugar phosphate isomerase/epimerase [Oscillochloris sp. ZM17-4]|uniref:sugar phosphate isomerase/epimerase family protein n=1 Tax=Oscillochloris sp. ZM17-4 TaxID=2866714 RepID=UPI001C73C860|nr:sugar phosphate isomerase/epimerase [Oscillochloris sp. ZM17-4]MBX0329614.1 sugar phosphate isomerase/epimerase [Oscillochloris sp. ZM17-4]
MRPDQIAVQLYTLRAETANDMLGTLRKVATMGYAAVELAGFGNSDAQAVGATLRKLGVRACAAHIALDRLEGSFDEALADLRAIGCDQAVVPFLPTELRADGVAVAARLNALAARLQAEGVRLAYHNHDFEFAPQQGGATLWEQLTANTDPALVGLEIDLFWADVAGVSPAELLGRHAGRVAMVHLKDRAPGVERRDAPVGAGVLPWAELIPRAEAAGARWFIVEQDHPQSPLADVAQSIGYLRGLAAA